VLCSRDVSNSPFVAISTTDILHNARKRKPKQKRKSDRKSRGHALLVSGQKQPPRYGHVHLHLTIDIANRNQARRGSNAGGGPTRGGLTDVGGAIVCCESLIQEGG
jgi:hypothetical protein